MKIRHSLHRLLAAAVTCLTLNLAHGLTIPAAEDTSSGLGKQQNALLTEKAGAATTLATSPRRTAFIRFEAGSYADVIPAIGVDKAWLMIYVADVEKPGALRVHAVTQDWTETVSGKVPAPTFAQADPIATIPTESVQPKQFVLVDVTGQVKNWLSTPDSDFGFAIASDGTANVQLGAKDGPSKGYAAVLQIEKKTVTNAPEDLRIIRGTVEYRNGALTIVAGEGFSISNPLNLESTGGPNDFNVTFTAPFSGLPTISVNGESTESPAHIIVSSRNVSSTGFGILDAAGTNGTRTHFIAVGPR